LSFTFVIVNLKFGLFSLRCMCRMLYRGFTLYWICMMYVVDPYFVVEPTWRKDKVLFLWLIGCLSAFLLRPSMVSGHKGKALWPMASLMTLSSDICFDLF